MGVPSWTTATPADNSWAVSEPLDRQDADRASLLVCGAVDRFRLPPPFRSLCEIQEARAATVHCGGTVGVGIGRGVAGSGRALPAPQMRSEEHTSELQSLMRISYAVFCLKTKTKKKTQQIKPEQYSKRTPKPK